MPVISRFFGIRVAFFYNDHPPPHFHVRYGEERAIIEIETMRLIAGWLPPRVHRLVTEWATRRLAELRDDWRLARMQSPLRPIEPLE
jgi:hypothetical protein